MSINADTSLYCLIGNPISKSLSPLIHNIIFEESGINAKYLALSVEDLEKAVHGIKALGIKGFNVTIPHKINIIKYLDEIDEKAKIVGAVNAVLNIGGKLKGFNTDGDGFIESMNNKGYSMEGNKVVMIGAGGAARSIAVSLAYKGINELLIINRTIENAYDLKSSIQNKFPQLKVKCYDSVQDNDLFKNTDLLINTTSIGMYPHVDNIPISPSLFSKQTIFYDIIYKPKMTRLLLEAKKQGYNIINGIDMLINQAIYSQLIWNSNLFEHRVDSELLVKKITKKIQLEI